MLISPFQLGGGGKSTGSGKRLSGWSGMSVRLPGPSEIPVCWLVEEETEFSVAVGLDRLSLLSAPSAFGSSRPCPASDGGCSAFSNRSVSLLNFQGKRERTDARFELCTGSLSPGISSTSPSANGDRPAQWGSTEPVLLMRFHRKMPTITTIIAIKMTPISTAPIMCPFWNLLSGVAVTVGEAVDMGSPFLTGSLRSLVGDEYLKGWVVGSILSVVGVWIVAGSEDPLITAKRGLQHSCT